jgi:glycosyltransferase involved in cell wall biosynthesis
MKILICSESYPPAISGVSLTTAGLAEFLVKKGDQVIIFTAGPGFKKTWIKRRRNLRIYYFRSLPNPFRRHFRFSLPQREVIEEAFVREKPDLVHLQDPSPLGLAVANQAKRLGVPLLVVHHFTLRLKDFYLAESFRKYLGKGFKEYLKFVYQKADRLVCPSGFCAEELKRIGFKAEVIPNGVDFKFFRPGGKKDEPPLVLYVGRIDPEKEIGILIEAARKLAAGVKARFVFVGPGELLDDFRRKVSASGLEDRMIFAGEKTSRELADLYRRASLFWIASRTESQGIVILEALASGLPVITSGKSGIREMIKDGINGLVVKRQSAAEYSRLALQLLNSRECRRKLAGAARQSIRKFDQQKSFEKYCRIYRELINK